MDRSCSRHGSEYKCMHCLDVESMIPLGRSRSVWPDNIKLDSNKVGCGLE
jgi:hypothetical protein